MKKIYIPGISILLMLTSCEDFLDETPDAFRTPQGFYQTEDEIDQAVAGVYVSNRALFSGESHLRFGESRSDNTNIEITGDAGGIGDDQLNEFTMDAANGRIADYWATNYSGISRANFVLDNIDRANFISPEVKDFREGEVLFLRTWFHFNLVRVFGDIPYITQPGQTPDQINSEEFIGRDPVAEVYENLLNDAQRAINLLPLPSEIEPEDVGRVTRGAAVMLKAKIHMAQGQYSEATPLLQQLTTYGYTLLPNYRDVFATKNNSESIFQIQYSFVLNQSSNFFTNYVPFASGESILGAGNTPNNRGNQFRPTNSLITLYQDGDARKTQNISVFVDGQGNEYPWASKFAFPFREPGQQDINFPMFRYADALLMLAECYEKTGVGDAAAIIRQLRVRAKLPDPNLTAQELGNLEQTIADERRRELAFEGHRFFDLLRTGKLVEVMTAHGAEEVANGLNVTADAYQNIRVLVGIPQAQVEQFGFVQTPGW